MKARLGIAPIAWSNDDLPELGGKTSLQTCLSESRKSGFSGVETGGKFPKSAVELKKVLSEHNLSLCGGWYSGTLLDKEIEEEKDRVLEQLNLFKALNAPCLVYGETAGTIQNIRNAPLNTRRKLDKDQFQSYGKKMTSFAEWCSEQGMPISFHHHMGTAIETERDVDLLMNNSGSALKLLYDAGHMAFSGGDVLAVIEKHSNRITHVHAKNIRMNVIDGLDRNKESFLDAVLKGAFTVPGDGSLNFNEIVQKLADKGYEGWFVVEAEQDPDLAPPFKYACIGQTALSEALSNAGYTILDNNE